MSVSAMSVVSARSTAQRADSLTIHNASDAHRVSLTQFHQNLLKNQGWDPTPYSAIDDILLPYKAALGDADVNAQSSDIGSQKLKYSLLHAIVSQRDAVELAAMLSTGHDPNARDDSFHTLLHRASRMCAPEVVRTLLEASAWARIADAEGRTPLHDAAWCARDAGGMDVARMLIDWDESLLRAKDRLGATPLEYVPAAQWMVWMQMLQGNRDAWWPPTDAPGLSCRNWSDRLGLTRESSGATFGAKTVASTVQYILDRCVPDWQAEGIGSSSCRRARRVCASCAGTSRLSGCTWGAPRQEGCGKVMEQEEEDKQAEAPLRVGAVGTTGSGKAVPCTTGLASVNTPSAAQRGSNEAGPSSSTASRGSRGGSPPLPLALPSHMPLAPVQAARGRSGTRESRRGSNCLQGIGERGSEGEEEDGENEREENGTSRNPNKWHRHSKRGRK